MNKNINIRTIGNKRRNKKKNKGSILSINIILNFVSKFSRYINGNNIIKSTMTTDQDVLS